MGAKAQLWNDRNDKNEGPTQRPPKDLSKTPILSLEITPESWEQWNEES